MQQKITGRTGLYSGAEFRRQWRKLGQQAWTRLPPHVRLQYVVKARQGRLRGRDADNKFVNIGAARPTADVLASDHLISTPQKKRDTGAAVSAMKQHLRRAKGPPRFAYKAAIAKTIRDLNQSRREAKVNFNVGWRVWRGAKAKREERDIKLGRPKGSSKCSDAVLSAELMIFSRVFTVV